MLRLTRNVLCGLRLVLWHRLICISCWVIFYLFLPLHVCFLPSTHNNCISMTRLFFPTGSYLWQLVYCLTTAADSSLINLRTAFRVCLSYTCECWGMHGLHFAVCGLSYDTVWSEFHVVCIKFVTYCEARQDLGRSDPRLLMDYMLTWCYQCVVLCATATT